jgi:hypothetical protein
MKQIFKPKQGRVASMFKTTALAAVLASTLMAASAEAAVLISDVLRRTSVFAGNQEAIEEESRALSGAFDKTLTSQQFLDEGFFSAIAVQNSTVDAQVFAGTGSAAFTAPGLSGTSALSDYDILFTLTSTYVFSGFATLTADQNPADSSKSLASSDASLQKRFENGLRQDIFDSAVNDTSSLLFTLLPGVYKFDITARARGSSEFDIAESGQAGFAFRFTLTEVVDVPPNNVPEPGLLALAMAGLAAIAAARKKKAAGEGDLEARDQGGKDARPVADSHRQFPRMGNIDSRDVFVD